MKLNPDCIRDILLEIESTSTISNAWTYNADSPSKRLSKYSKDEIGYHARQCAKSNLVDGFHLYGDCNTISVSDLTPKGHEFLANIRNDSFFNNVKQIGKKLGTTSLNDLHQIAVNCAAVLIKSYFNLP